eukprot:6210355-Pleurochrysis_carterae.AAC.2
MDARSGPAGVRGNVRATAHRFSDAVIGHCHRAARSGRQRERLRDHRQVGADLGVGVHVGVCVGVGVSDGVGVGVGYGVGVGVGVGVATVVAVAFHVAIVASAVVVAFTAESLDKAGRVEHGAQQQRGEGFCRIASNVTIGIAGHGDGELLHGAMY